VRNSCGINAALRLALERRVHSGSEELGHAPCERRRTRFTVEVDFAADNAWSEYARLMVPPGQTIRHIFPDGYSAHWVRLKADTSTTATATFTYGY
jgi:hypothetical protein